MRRALMILLFAAGCGGTIETTTQPLKVAPIDGLPAYDGGRVLHPWHSSKPARVRSPKRLTSQARRARRSVVFPRKSC